MRLHPLKAWRLTNGLSQEDLGKAVDCHQTMIAKIETWGAEPSLDLARRLEDVTGIPMGILFPRPPHVIAQKEDRPA